MFSRLDPSLKLFSILTIAIVACLAILPYMSSRQANDTFDSLKTGASKERAYNAVLSLLKDAETGQRGYLLGSDDSFLGPYAAGVAGMPAALAELQRLASSAEERALVNRIAELSEAKLAEMSRTVALKKAGQAQAAIDMVASRRGQALMDELRGLLGPQLQVLAEQRTRLREEISASLHYNTALGIGASLACLVVIGSAVYIAARSLRERAEAASTAQQLARNNAQLADEAAVRAERLALTADMLHALDSVKAPAELGQVLPAFLPRLLPGTSGAVYLYRNSRDFLEPKAHWGAAHAGLDLVNPSDCWGLRLGKQHRAAMGDLRCAHGQALQDSDSRICVPMISQGDVVGLIVIDAPGRQGPPADAAVLATVAEQLGLAISNVSLRESLRQQSTVDPLTGMYNRRFFDESLKRELLRARRAQSSCAVVMVDLDHFKRINDTYGHEGGDLVLKAAARVLLDRVRASDIAGRYGGEEFILLLPDCGAEAAHQLAEGIRAALADIAIQYLGRTISGITASFGIAAWPLHAEDEQSVLKAADMALYEAKKSGRDRVIVAQQPG